MKQRVVWDIPHGSPGPSFPHRIFTLWPRMIDEEPKGGFMGLYAQKSTCKLQNFYILYTQRNEQLS